MKDNCRNDCVEKVRFPKTLKNRPGLSHFDYRIGTYADIREALLHNLDKAPGLSQWTHRGADDPGIALLEGAAILGDILTFYQERYANEAYLRTAEWRESISDLVRLLGYRLAPGLGGRASFAFEVKGDQPVVIPPNFPLRTDVEGAAAPVDFETVAPLNATSSLIAYPWLSKFNLYRPLATPPITVETNEFYIQTPDQLTAATPVVLKAGDRLLLGSPDPIVNPTRLTNPEIVIVDSIRVLHGVKIFKIKGKLKSGPAQLAAYKLGRSFHHFGHNGPRILVKPPDPVTSTATKDGETTTVVSDPPLEFNISFYRDITATTTKSAITADAANPRAPKSSSSNYGLIMMAVLMSANTSGGQEKVATDHRMTQANAGASAPRATPGQPLVIVAPNLAATDFPLDGEVQDLATGLTLVVHGQFYPTNAGGTPAEFATIRDVSNIKTTSVTWGLSTGTVSMVTLKSALGGSTGGNNFMDIAQVQFHETLSPPLILRAAFQPAASAPHNILNFFGTLAQARNLKGRVLSLVAATWARQVSVTDVAESSADGEHPLLHKITIDAVDLDRADFPNDPPYKVTVYGNVVEATQGKLENLVPLGNGDSRLAFQNFELPKSPLTYLRSDTETPPQVPELKVYVNNRAWKRVTSFFNRKPDEEIYIVREDPDNKSWVQFGDGKMGARVPSGVKNVTAVYRSGTGAFGKLKEKAQVKASAKLDRLDKIQMPLAAEDGAQPEDGETAREAAPGKIQSLDRLVSLEDFETEALSLPGVTKAAAKWDLAGGGIPQVSVSVLMEKGRNQTVEQLRGTFATANSGRGPNRVPINPISGQLVYVAIHAKFGYDSTYLEEEVRKEIQKALGVSTAKPNVVDDPTGLFSLRRRSFGQREYATTVAGVIQQVEGVIWAEVIRFQSLNDPTTPPAPLVQVDPALLPVPTPVSFAPTIESRGDVVLSLYEGHLQLTAEQVPTREVSS